MLRDTASNEIFTILIMCGLLAISLAKVAYTNRFNDFSAILLNSKYLNIYSKDQKFLDWFDALMFINFIISTAIFICICYNALFSNLQLDINVMFKIVFSIGIFLLVKVLFERLLASIFNIDEVMDNYLFQKTSYKNFFGMLLIPVNAILIYSITPSKTIIYITLSLLIFLTIAGLSSSLKRYRSLIKSNLFYFILYLCTLEIAPYIILYKFVTMY
ncbi:DUF4271 domain-containing protein [Formosa sp. S-31]|uniref:DUF4271 domain-containing protein n=1 Tax=Formosa sp. S-31 TaxID=2790949 RepID=UPI003EB89667